MRYLSRRLLQAVFLLFGVSVLTFLFSSLAPGNYLDEIRLNPQISSATLASLRVQYDLDRPLPLRYARWVKSIARGQLGYSFAYNSPVAPLLSVRARNTLLLTLTSTLLAWALALPLGVWSAEKLGRLPDRALSLVAATLMVIPDLVLALGLLILAARSVSRTYRPSENFAIWSCTWRYRLPRWCYRHSQSWCGMSVPQWQRHSAHRLCARLWRTAFRVANCSIATRFALRPIR